MRIPSDLWSLPAIRSLAPRSGRHLACRGAGHPCPADSHGSLARSAAPAFDWFQAPLGAVRKPQLDATSRCRFMNMLIKGKPSKLALFVTDAANKMPAEMQHCLSGRSLTKTASEIRTEPDLDTLIRLSRLLVFEYATKMMTSLLSLDQPSLNPAKPSIQKNGHRVNGAHDRFLLPLLLGKKAGMRASDFLRQRRHIKSVRKNLSCAWVNAWGGERFWLGHGVQRHAGRPVFTLFHVHSPPFNHQIENNCIAANDQHASRPNSPRLSEGRLFRAFLQTLDTIELDKDILLIHPHTKIRTVPKRSDHPETRSWPAFQSAKIPQKNK